MLAGCGYTAIPKAEYALPDCHLPAARADHSAPCRTHSQPDAGTAQGTARFAGHGQHPITLSLLGLSRTGLVGHRAARPLELSIVHAVHSTSGRAELAVGVADLVGSSGSPAGDDPGQQGG